MSRILPWPSTHKREIWHLGIFDDINLQSGINDSNARRVKNLTKKLAEVIPDNDLQYKFVDIGCNCGHFLRELWKRGARNLVGIEPRGGHLDFARKWIGIHDADVTLIEKPCEEIEPEELDDSIVLALGLIYHLPKPDKLLDIIRLSKFRYCLLESQLFWKSFYKTEQEKNPQHTYKTCDVWQPDSRTIESKLRRRGFKCERIPYDPGRGHWRGLWKFWKGEA